jgi:hypothetical protein
MFKLFIGDPAQFWKPVKNGTINENIEETYINIGKRLAADVAPGLEMANSDTSSYEQIF